MGSSEFHSSTYLCVLISIVSLNYSFLIQSYHTIPQMSLYIRNFPISLLRHCNCVLSIKVIKINRQNIVVQLAQI